MGRWSLSTISNSVVNLERLHPSNLAGRQGHGVSLFPLADSLIFLASRQQHFAILSPSVVKRMGFDGEKGD